MEPVYHFTGDLEVDWKALVPLWQQSECVMSGEVGPTWRMPPQHKVCLEFAEQYPDSKAFLIAQLSDSDPRLTAYAFKILIRICELRPADISPAVAARSDEITVIMHSRGDTQTLQDFFAGYFDSCDHDSLMEDDERSMSWQDNELAEYDRSTRRSGQAPE
ncbi:hypothetical protein [Prosthecobacter sp.]|uniref:hypothetical protein n=1 Tax=Prosthecobacter sp. TaxID=1965333 RepID=UPI0037847C2A